MTIEHNFSEAKLFVIGYLNRASLTESSEFSSVIKGVHIRASHTLQGSVALCQQKF